MSIWENSNAYSQVSHELQGSCLRNHFELLVIIPRQNFEEKFTEVTIRLSFATTARGVMVL